MRFHCCSLKKYMLLQRQPAVAACASFSRSILQPTQQVVRSCSSKDASTNMGDLLPYDPSLAKPKSAAVSALCVRYDFSKNPAILREYRRFDGGVRIGKLLEDMDTASGDVASRHVFLEATPRKPSGDINMLMPDNVTACVDSIRVLQSVPDVTKGDMDMQIEGRIIWTGNSSMLIRVRVWTIPSAWMIDESHPKLGPKEPDDTVPSISHRTSDDASMSMKRLYLVARKNSTPDRIGHEYTARGTEEALDIMMPPESDRNVFLEGHFLFVALSKQRKPLKINPVFIESWKDQELSAFGEHLKEERAKTKATSLAKLVPNYEEMQYIHDKYQRGFLVSQSDSGDMLDTATSVARTMNANSFVPVGSTRLRNVNVTHPQEQNAGGKIFGGQLMRQATELANQTCQLFWTMGAQSELIGSGKFGIDIVCIDDIEFVRPVAIGSLMSFTAHVGYTSLDYCVVLVEAEIYDYNEHRKFVSNNLSFIFKTKSGNPFLNVMPHGYGDCILHLRARRKLKAFLAKEGIIHE